MWNSLGTKSELCYCSGNKEGLFSQTPEKPKKKQNSGCLQGITSFQLFRSSKSGGSSVIYALFQTLGLAVLTFVYLSPGEYHISVTPKHW